MKKISNVYAVLAIATVCTAQSVVPPPPDCVASSSKSTGARSVNRASVVCPPSLAPIIGIGTPGSIPVFTTSTNVGDSVISQSPTGGIGIGGANSGTSKLSVNGNITAIGNVSAGAVIANGAVTASTVAATGTVTGSDITATGSVKANNLTATGNVAGANVTATGTVSANGVSASGNITTNGLTATGDISAFHYNIGGERVFSTPGAANTLVGAGAGKTNSGASNSYFGFNAGQFGLVGSGNSFFGAEAGSSNGFNENSFFGYAAGKDFSGGNRNTLLGAGTLATNGIQNATAVGSKAAVMQSNTVVLGAVDGLNGGTGVNVGIGTSQPATRLEVVGGDIFVASGGRGVILRTTSGFNCARLSVNDQGQLSAAVMTCPGSSGL